MKIKSSLGCLTLLIFAVPASKGAGWAAPTQIRGLSVWPMDEVPDRDRKGLEAGSRTSRGSRVSMKA